MGVRRFTAGIAVLILGFGVAACGDDEETTTAAEEAASAEEVTITTGDISGGFSWEVEPTPTTETQSIKYVNESKEPHALVFASINEGYTLEEAYEAQGRKGTANVIVETGRSDSPGPGETVEIAIDKPIEPSDNYVLLCPIPGHYQAGQLEEFEIE